MEQFKPTKAGAFPARTGMNRRIAEKVLPLLGVPRTHGDEPDGDETFRIFDKRSPHARG